MHGLQTLLWRQPSGALCCHCAVLPCLGSSDAGTLLSGVIVLRRLAAFDNVRQVQVAGLLVHRPPSASDFQAPDSRSK